MELKKPNEQKRYYIAYMDMLGYKDFFQKHAEQVPQFLNSIYDAVRNTKDCISKTNQSQILYACTGMDISIKMYSDNILLCVGVGETQFEIVKLLTFLSLVADVQRNFVVNYGLFLRGGITVGELSFNEDFVFGQGVIDAVDMEARANYPRIMLSQSIIDFLFQNHYISDCELQQCTDIIGKFQSENQVANEEQVLLKAYAPRISNELFCSRWKYNLVIEDADGVSALNYLYNLNPRTMLGEAWWQSASGFLSAYFPQDFSMVASDGYNYMEMLQSHKQRVQEKLLEQGKYDDIETSDFKSADAREKVLKKYLWVVKFHNFIAERECAPECIINAQVNCDSRFMKMTASVSNPINGTI